MTMKSEYQIGGFHSTSFQGSVRSFFVPEVQSKSMSSALGCGTQSCFFGQPPSERHTLVPGGG